jgi:hypothetical protein
LKDYDNFILVNKWILNQLNKTVKGVNECFDKYDFGNATIDSEFELLLLRGSKFLIESVSYEPEPLHKQKFLKYKNIPCYEKLPVFVKTYTMRLVSQPSLEELKNTYSKMMKDIKLELKPWDLKEMKLSDLHPSKASTKTIK